MMPLTRQAHAKNPLNGKETQRNGWAVSWGATTDSQTGATMDSQMGATADSQMGAIVDSQTGATTDSQTHHFIFGMTPWGRHCFIEKTTSKNWRRPNPGLCSTRIWVLPITLSVNSRCRGSEQAGVLGKFQSPQMWRLKETEVQEAGELEKGFDSSSRAQQCSQP